MKLSDAYVELINEAMYSGDQAAQYNFLNSAIRSILQTAALVALEYCHNKTPDVDQTPLPGHALALRSPSDGDLVRTLSAAIPLARQSGLDHCAAGWFLRQGEAGDSLARQAEVWVKHRNDHPGHGVVAANVVTAGLAWMPMFAKSLVSGLDVLLPDADQTGATYLHYPNGDSEKLTTVKVTESKPIVIRSIVQRGASWRVTYQTLSPSFSVESFYELEASCPFIRLSESESHRYRHYRLVVPNADADWTVDACLPTRQTPVFTGREQELSHIREWLNDTDSRVCNVYGEGGIGKTTLVLEFLNSVLLQESEPPDWRPEVVCFFSAKETRWGPNGLETLVGAVPSVADAAREVARVYEEVLDKGWYEGEPRKVVDKAAQLLSGLGLTRDKVLLVLDNSETLARTPGEEEELGKLIAHMGRRLCRVLLTSRRRERLEAHPIDIAPMDESSGVALLRKLGQEYKAMPLLQAGEPALRKIARRLGGRPLLMDVCGRLIGKFSYSLEAGMDSVLRMAAGDLGVFLYEDAWARTPREVQIALLVLGQLAGSVSGEFVGWVCVETGVAHGDLMRTLDETRFGVLLDYGQQFDLNLDPSARAFLGKKLQASPAEDQERVNLAASRVRRKAEQWLKANHDVVSDRIAAAFRSEPAKLAHMATKEGNLPEAVKWFEEALNVDRGNACLVERFAWFLVTQVRDYQRALTVARRAIEESPSDPEPLFTAGMAAARLGEASEAERLLGRAKECGKMAHLCDLQMAWARVYAIQGTFRRDPVDLAAVEAHEAAARILADRAVLPSPVTAMERKHMEEVEKVRQRLADGRERAQKLRMARRGTGRRASND